MEPVPAVTVRPHGTAADAVDKKKSSLDGDASAHEKKGHKSKSNAHASTPSVGAGPAHASGSTVRAKPVQRAVIDEAMISDAIRQESATTALADRITALKAHDGKAGVADVTGAAGVTTVVDPLKPAIAIDFQEVDTLLLSFRNVAVIANLDGFRKLTKLQLDNNHITKIDGVQHLTQLKWLDLSFNQIKKIENLQTLTQLTDLSLFNNQIDTIEGLDALTQLSVLSIGNNVIAQLASIPSLRHLKKLRLLNLKGNPVCQDDLYQPTVLGYITSLKYLDYEMIDQAQIRKAQDRLRDNLVQIEEEEKMLLTHQQEDTQAQLKETEAKQANVAGIDRLLDTIMRDDAENPKLRNLPGFDQLIAEYRSNFQRVSADFVQAMMRHAASKGCERAAFEEALQQAKKANEAKCIQKIQEFESARKKAFALYEESVQNRASEPHILERLRDDLQSLSDDLMDAEMLLVEQVGDLIGEFEDLYMGMVTANVNQIQNAFRGLEEAANGYVQSLQDLVAKLIPKYQEGAFRDNLEASQVLADKEGLKNAVSSSHDHHLGRIVAKSDEINEAEDRQAKQLLARFKQEEYNRNRARVSEVYELVQRYAKSMEEKLQGDGADALRILQQHDD